VAFWRISRLVPLAQHLHQFRLDLSWTNACVVLGEG
jgi:hypothetical protein